MDRKRALIAGFVGGLAHFVVIGGLYAYLRGPEMFGYSTHANSFLWLTDPVRIYVLFGSFLLGVVPAVLWSEYRLVTPTVTIGVIIVSILLFGPVGLERVTQHGGPLSIFGFYFIFWFAPLIAAIVIGGVEYGMRRLLRKNSTDNGRNKSGGRSSE